MIETYYITEFGVEYWSYGGRFETAADAKSALPALLRSAQKHNEDNDVRYVKITREVMK